MTPPSQSVEVTHTATFNATVKGVGNSAFTYQWRKGSHGRFLKEKTGPILKLKDVSKRNEAHYSCYVENMFGDFAISNAVYLTVTSK